MLVNNLHVILFDKYYLTI